MTGRVALIAALLFALILFAVPVAITVLTSFRNSPAMGIVGDKWSFANYTHLLVDDYFAGLLTTTMGLGFVSAAIATILAFPVAYFVVRSSSRWVQVTLMLVIAPMFISSVVRALGWILILGEFGPLNRMLQALHVVSEPLKLTYNFAAVVIGSVHWVFPFVVLILIAGIHAVKPMLEEAASDLGASAWQVFTYILLPLTLPAIMSAFLLALSATISGYTTVVLLGGGKVKVVSMMIADYFRGVLDYPAGAAVSVVLLIATLGVALLGNSVGGNAASHRRTA